MSGLPLDKDGLYFIPLGGAEQFGVNLNVYAHGGRFLVVDCGLGFADDRFPGSDLLLPDPDALESVKDRIDALVITHAHEDHIGAVAYLWERLECPIFTTPFTAVVLRQKLKDANVRGANVQAVENLQTRKIGPFSVKFIPVAHSVPDSSALLIDTPLGRVVHSGDWNLDPTPIMGNITDSAPFIAAGDQGVLAYIGDSTNAMVEGSAGSEKEVEIGLEAEFRKCTGRIAVTIFSSNISRIISISRAAKKCGRRVVVVGRSLHNMIGCALKCGYLEDVEEFLPDTEIPFMNPKEILMLVTGSQGEQRSALAKISRGEFRGISLGKGDTAIFSARAIPGNEREISAVKNNLIGSGVRVVAHYNTQNTIHVSGHPCRDEIAQMYSWVRPKVVIPVHGERMQLEAQAKFARDHKVPTVIVPANGSVIRLAPGTAEIVDHVPTGLLAVDQKRIITSEHATISQRRKLQFTGVVHISIALDAKGKIRNEPLIHTLGLIDQDDPEDRDIEDQMFEEIYDIMKEMKAQERSKDHVVSEELRIGMRRFFSHILGMKPEVNVHVIRV
jgi:ribonuclease J